MPNYVFVLTRHVKDERTNKYWNTSVKLLRTFYPYRNIIIIDDNSNQEFVRAFHEYSFLTVIQSEFPQRGELLPFLYFLRHPEWENAVILHDSTFLHLHFPFEKLSVPVLPIWNFEYDRENLPNLYRITSVLNQRHLVQSMLGTNEPTLHTISKLGIHAKKEKFVCCFGAQMYLRYSLLARIEAKFHLTQLEKVIHCRTDRCAFERIIGALITLEYPRIFRHPSLLGNIQLKGDWGYSLENYENDILQKRLPRKIIKIWTGR